MEKSFGTVLSDTAHAASSRHGATVLDITSPKIFAAFVALALCLTGIDNPIGWGTNYSDFRGVTVSIGATYLISFLVFLGIAAIFFKLRVRGVGRVGQNNSLILNINERWVLLVFAISAVFQIAKFINIGSIPLIGDPLARYKLTLGGFEDYPSRLLAPMASALFCLDALRQRKRSVLRLVAVSVGLLLNLLMTQRQEVANLLFGCFLIWAFNKRAKVTRLIVLAMFVLVLTYIVVGLGAVLRFGGDRISSSVSSLMLPVWIVHAEVTVPYVFGEHVVSALGGKMLYGLYTFGEFISIFSPVKMLHGASLMQRLFTDKDTAQSVGAPYSYFIDFGYVGLIAVAFVNALIMGFYYRKTATQRNSSYWLTAYSTVFLSAFWSVRSGISLFYPLVLYILLAIFCVTEGGSKMTSQLRSMARFIFAASLFVSLAALMVRS